MTQTKVFVDPLGPVKAYLRSLNLASVGQRVYIGDPEGATLPYIAIMLVSGDVDQSEAPLGLPRVQCCVQAATEGDAATVVWDLVSQVESIVAGTRLDSTQVCMGARLVLGPVPRVDEAGPRYLCDFEFSTVAR